MVVRIIALCVAAAMIASALRVQRPEIATAISLAAGLTALALLVTEMVQMPGWLDALRTLMPRDNGIAAAVLKGAGIALLAQFGAQLCADAGERALAGRIALAARVAILGVAAPMLSDIVDAVSGILA